MRSILIRQAWSLLIGLISIGMMTQPRAEDLQALYQKALANDPEFLAAQYAHAAANESVALARGKMYPQIGLEYSHSDTEQDIKQSNNIFQPTGEDDFETTDISLTLVQPVYNRGIYVGYQQAKADILRADAELDSKQQDLILRTAQAYLEVLAANDQLDLIQAEKLAVGKQLDRVQNMMTSGMARKTELYEARARFAKTQADAITALSDLDDKREALQEIVGPLTGALAVLNPDISLSIPDPETPQHWMELAVAQNPRVIMQQQQVEISRYEIRLNKAGHLPTVDFTARVNELDSGGSVLGNDNELETTEFVLRLNLPIYQGGAVTSNTRRSSQLHQKALQDLTSIQRTVRRAAKSAYNGIVRAISLVDAQKETVSAQQLALLARQQGYRSGLYTNLDVLDAERDVFEAKRDLARARYDYLLNHLSLKHSIGSLNEQDIADINRMLQPAASRT